MLYVCGGKHRKEDDIFWHVGEEFPILGEEQMSRITLVQADFDELDLIRDNFKNLPFHDGRVCLWRGDFARFIVDGLQMIGLKRNENSY